MDVCVGHCYHESRIETYRGGGVGFDNRTVTSSCCHCAAVVSMRYSLKADPAHGPWLKAGIWAPTPENE